MEFHPTVFTLVFASFLVCGLSDLYITTLPEGIVLNKDISSIQFGDVSQVINYLLGLPMDRESSWKGVTRVDVFNRPHANMYINIYAPDGVELSLNKYDARYKVDSFTGGEVPSLESTNAALYRLFHHEKPMVVYYETDGLLLSTTKVNADVLNDLPATLETMRERLQTGSSLLNKLDSNSCLNPANNADAYFLGELQTLKDILLKLSNENDRVTDNVPDSFFFSLTTLGGLEGQYGIDSCQMKAAVRLLHIFLPELISAFDQLYNGHLLSEVNIAGTIGMSFNEVSIRHTRSLQEAKDSNSTTNTTTPIGNLATPLDENYPVVVNLTFWVTVIFALATLMASYGIWFMDPGRDSIIYRMTSQRLKID